MRNARMNFTGPTGRKLPFRAGRCDFSRLYIILTRRNPRGIMLREPDPGVIAFRFGCRQQYDLALRMKPALRDLY